MLERILGVITLKTPIYRQIADDKTATTQAAMIVVIVTLIQGFCTGLVKSTASGVSVDLLGGLAQAVSNLVLGLIGWVVSAWLLAMIAKALGGKTDTSEMLRVTGFVQVFGLTGILNLAALISPVLICVTSIISIVVLILSLIGYTIGVREAAEFSTGKAVATALVAVIANFLIVVVVGGMIATAVIGALALLAGGAR